MSKRNDGGPAFPVTAHGLACQGMTLRDFFAAHAPFPSATNTLTVDEIRALLPDSEVPDDALGQLKLVMRATALVRYAYAAAMLAEREKRDD